MRDITADAVLRAVAEYDDLGRVAFLAKYGFRPARKFELHYGSRVYDSKAIIGVAHRYATGESLPSAEFSGGGQTVRPLLALGFDVRDRSARNLPSSAGPIGDVAGVEVGAEFVNRHAVRDAGVHRALQAGIVGTEQTGAESIVVSGGYEDDEDFGSSLIYTGHGGQGERNRQTEDQTFTAPGNAALLTSKLTGAPVRVVRGAHRRAPAHAPDTGYRYDGLYRVADAWRERGRHGHLICRFRMVDFTVPATENDDLENGGPPDAAHHSPPGVDVPARKATTTDRVVRSISVAEYVKAIHEHVCQTCGIVLMIGPRRYSEAAHVQALGRPHNGPDSVNNVLCLCPTCHVLFDNGALIVNEDLAIVINKKSTGRSLRIDSRHLVAADHLAYHRSVHA